MTDRSPLSLFSDLRARLDAAGVDRGPLRRAGLFSVLLVVLLVAGRAFGPDRAGASAPTPERQDVRSAETVAAPPAPRSGSAWTGGRVLAVLVLLIGGGVALVLRRRPLRAGATGSEFEVLETVALGTGASLRLVGCGGEVLLLSVGAEGARLLRWWPRASFAERPTFAAVLATHAEPAATEPVPSVSIASEPGGVGTYRDTPLRATAYEVSGDGAHAPATSPLPPGEGQGEGRAVLGPSPTPNAPPAPHPHAPHSRGSLFPAARPALRQFHA